VILLCIAALAACSGPDKRSTGGPKKAPKLPPVKPDALAQFDAGLRALSLAGDDPTPDALEKAKERFHRAVDIDGKVWEAWHNLGAIYYMEGEDDEAVESYGKALKINPAHVASMLGRAEAHRRAGNTKSARSDYRNALDQLDDESEERRNAAARLASLLRDAGQFEDGLDVLRETMRMVGADAAVYVELGLIYLEQERYDLCTLALSKAAEIDKENPAIYNALALLSLERGNAQEAFDRFDHATSLDPTYLDARFNKASVLLDAGDYARALAELEEVLGQDKFDLDARVALGIAQRGLGQFDQAEATWEKVVKSAPRRSRVRADALYNIAILKVDFDDEQKGAKAALDRFLQNAPGNHPKRGEAEEKKKELGL
jgi:tetratricopeptide (TPR) repeat protein